MNRTGFPLSQELLDLLPDEVPIPEPEQFITRATLRPGIGCCLLGWCGQVLFNKPELLDTSFDQDNLARELARFVSGSSYPVEWNDYESSPQERADAWRSAMIELGYEIE